jgi:outer membrane protein
MTRPVVHVLTLAALVAAAPLAAAGQQAPAPAAAPPAQAAPAQPPAPAAQPVAAPAAKVLTLNEAIKNALDRQPTLLQARANTSAAQARTDEAMSGMLPQLSASGSYARSTNNFAPRPGSNPSATVSAGPPGTSWDTTSFWQGGVTLSQLIWDFSQTSGRWRAAQATASAQQSSEQATRNQVVLGVESAYFTARAGKDLMKVAADNLANVEAHLRQTEGFVRAGTHPEIDLAQARTDQANAKVQLINAENAYLTEKAQLNQAMGIEGTTDYEVASDTLPAVQGEDLNLDPLLDEALKARPDIASLEQQVLAQDLTTSAVKGDYWPSLGVQTGFNEAGPSLGSLVWNWNVEATLTWNIFQGGLTRAQVREGNANADALRAQVAGLRQQVRVDVEQARLAVRASKQALDAAGEAEANAQLRLKLAEARFRTGVGSAIELGDAQVALTTAAGQRVQAQYNLSTSRAQLMRALGRTPQI